MVANGGSISFFIFVGMTFPSHEMPLLPNMDLELSAKTKTGKGEQHVFQNCSGRAHSHGEIYGVWFAACFPPKNWRF